MGTPVRVINDPVKTGWIDGELYLEVHPRLVQESAEAAVATPLSDALARELREVAGASAARLDWAAVEQTLREQRGVPIRVTTGLSARDLGAKLRTLAGGLRE